MAAVTAQMVKELRDRTQAGMSDCKNALTESGGEMEKAVEIILKKGLAKNAKRAGAVATEGEVRAQVTADGRHGAMAEVNIQTDFAARNDLFKQFVADLMTLAAGAKEGQNLEELTYPGTTKTVAQVRDERMAQIGEKISIRRWTRIDLSAQAGSIHSYVHLGGKIGVLLETAAGSPAVAEHSAFKKFVDDVAMQIAAMSPSYLTRAQVAPEAVEKQREIYTAQLREEPKPKPEAAWPKIIEGKLNKWYSEICLIDQDSVIVPGSSIDQVRAAAAKEAGGTIELKRFVRYERGEGLDKGKKDDFATEVAKMAGQH